MTEVFDKVPYLGVRFKP